MKHRIQILLLFLAFSLNESVAVTYSDSAALAALQAEKMPLYIVDGKIGVNPAELPPADSIASTTILTKEEALELYGERAKNGVFIVKTNKFVRTHGGGDKTQYDSNAPKGGHKKGTPSKLGRWINKMTGGNTFLGIILCLIIVLAIMAMPTIVSVLLRRQNSNKRSKRTFSNYDTGTFDAEGVRFEAVKQPKNYFIPIICLAIISMFGIILYKTFISTPPIGILLVILIFFGGISVLFILAFVNSCKLLRSYLVIDEKGIRGYVANTERLNLKMDFRKIDISWEQIKRAQMDGYLITFFKKGTKIPDDMVDFAELADTDITEKEIENSIYQLDLSAFPINKVKDSINYFYARKNGIAKQPSLIKPDPLEKTNVLTIILVILAVLLLSYLAK